MRERVGNLFEDTALAYPRNMALSPIDLESEFGTLLDQVPMFSERTELRELSGGITNRNIMVKTSTGKYVARISSNQSSLLNIDRHSEFENSKIAAAIGIGAPVHQYQPDLGMLVIGFIEGRTFNADDVAKNLGRIASSCRQLHAAPLFDREFNMFNVQRNYLDIVRQRGFKIPPDYDDYAHFARTMEKSFAKAPVALTPCNNDLLPANFIDDGKKVWLIDFEYSGNNDPCFELGNIWSEAKLNDEALIELVDAYYGEHRPEKIARAWLFSVMAHYGWTLWASIQDSISTIDFDFWQWGMAKYEESQRLFTSTRFAREISAL